MMTDADRSRIIKTLLRFTGNPFSGLVIAEHQPFVLDDVQFRNCQDTLWKEEGESVSRPNGTHIDQSSHKSQPKSNEGMAIVSRRCRKYGAFSSPKMGLMHKNGVNAL